MKSAMARGWESKSVESQIESSHSGRLAGRKPENEPEWLEARHRRESLLLARKRLLDQIQSSTDPRYREMMERALADLDKLLPLTH